MEHDGCVGCKYENESPDSKYCLGCKQNAIDKYTPMTNADKIRNMSDEELYNFIEKIKMCGGLIRTEETSSECRGCSDGFCCNVLQWLQSEVEGSE